MHFHTNDNIPKTMLFTLLSAAFVLEHGGIIYIQLNNGIFKIFTSKHTLNETPGCSYISLQVIDGS